MYLHIGGDMVVPKRELIAVIDLVGNQSAPATKEFLELAASEGKIHATKETGKNKTCIVTEKDIYLSSISASTITKRLRGC